MVASCYRRMGAYPQALKLYEDAQMTSDLRAKPLDFGGF